MAIFATLNKRVDVDGRPNRRSFMGGLQPFRPREIQMTKTLAVMLDDMNNKANKNSFVNGHPTWRR